MQRLTYCQLNLHHIIIIHIICSISAGVSKSSTVVRRHAKYQSQHIVVRENIGVLNFCFRVQMRKLLPILDRFQFLFIYCTFLIQTAILVLYLTRKLLYTDDEATILFHVYTGLVYLFPLIGAIVADTWLGRYR